MLALTFALALLAPFAPQRGDPTESAEARRRAVETGLLPTPWVEGHAFALEERMRALRVPGLSVAVVSGFELDWAHGWGLRDADSGAPVTRDTLFQAGSISKPVAALAALTLARDGRLDLDQPVADALRSWSLPETPFYDEVALTPRHLLSHTGGVTVHGFAGYASFERAPTLLEVLAGRPPCNSDPITLDRAPGLGFRYAGGGSTILQAAMIDVTGQEFPALVRERVLAPLGMARSTYAQPLPVERFTDHCAGHLEDGRVQPGRFRVHPEQFAAGLWTTPGDLARLVLDLQRALHGENGRLLPPELARRMVTPVDGGPTALGWFVEERGGRVWFQHGGSNIGFKNQLWASRDDGRAVIVMTNGEQGGQLMAEVLRGVARVYGWDELVEAPLAAARPDAATLEACAGRYGFAEDDVLRVWLEDGRLRARRPPQPSATLAPVGEREFLVLGTSARVVFEPRAGGGSPALVLRQGAGRERAERLGEYDRWPTDDLLAGEVEAALDFYREVHDANAQDPLVQVERLDELALGLWSQGDEAAGLGLARLDVELYPRDANAWNTLGRLSAAAGEVDAALAACAECLARLEDDPRLDADGRRWLGASARTLRAWLSRER